MLFFTKKFADLFGFRHVFLLTDTDFYRFEGSYSFIDLFSPYTKNLKPQYFCFPPLSVSSCIQFFHLDDTTTIGFLSGSGYVTILAPFFDKLTIYPYFYYKSDGRLETNEYPDMASLTKYHILFLYQNTISVVSRISSSVVKTCQLSIKVTFCNYNTQLNSLVATNGLDIVAFTVRNEDKYVWRAFAKLGDFEKSIELCTQYDKEHLPYLNRMFAEQLFREGTYQKAAKKFSESNEHFEEVMMKFLLADQTESLLLYLEKFQKSQEGKSTKAELTALSTIRLELMLKIVVNSKNTSEERANSQAFLNSFAELNSSAQVDKETISELLLAYGRVPDYLILNQIAVLN